MLCEMGDIHFGERILFRKSDIRKSILVEERR